MPENLSSSSFTGIFSGQRVTVTNHGNLFPIAMVKNIDYIEKTATIRWESSRKLSTVKLSHIQPYVDDDQSKRKRKSTDFLHDQHMVKQKKRKKNRIIKSMMMITKLS